MKNRKNRKILLSLLKILGFISSVLCVLSYFILAWWFPHLFSIIAIVSGAILIKIRESKDDFVSGISCILVGSIISVYLIGWIVNGSLKIKIPEFVNFVFGIASLILFIIGLLISVRYIESRFNKDKNDTVKNP